ncbi:hypothetical protein Tco_1159347, partial [Tanacetum coccineum]
ETIRDTIAQTRSENVSKLSNDPLLARGNILRSGEDSLKLKELMKLCTNLQNRVIDLEKTKTSQAQEISSLKKRVKRLEKKGKLMGLKDYTSTHFDADTYMFEILDLFGDEVVVESENVINVVSTIPVSAATTTTTVITDDEITLAKALAELRSAKLPTTTASTRITDMSTRPRAKGLDRGKGKMVEPEPVKKLSKKDQLILDEELAFKLQAEEEEEERLAREKDQQIEEANILS